MYDTKLVNICAIKNLNVLFWQMIHRWEKSSQGLKAPPGGRAEIKNVKKKVFNINF